jgi:hypothetical protein
LIAAAASRTAAIVTGNSLIAAPPHPNIPLSALGGLGGREGRGEVGGAQGSEQPRDPPHPPGPTGQARGLAAHAVPGPSLSPRKRAERGA